MISFTHEETFGRKKKNERVLNVSKEFRDFDSCSSNAVGSRFPRNRRVLTLKKPPRNPLTPVSLHPPGFFYHEDTGRFVSSREMGSVLPIPVT